MAKWLHTSEKAVTKNLRLPLTHISLVARTEKKSKEREHVPLEMPMRDRKRESGIALHCAALQKAGIVEKGWKESGLELDLSSSLHIGT